MKRDIELECRAAAAGIAYVQAYIDAFPACEARTQAETRIADAKKSLACDAARPSLAHACRSMSMMYKIGTPEYMAVQSLYDEVYEGQLD